MTAPVLNHTTATKVAIYERDMRAVARVFYKAMRGNGAQAQAGFFSVAGAAMTHTFNSLVDVYGREDAERILDELVKNAKGGGAFG